MPTWAQYLLGAPLILALVGIAAKILSDRRVENAAFRREGSEVVTPARELVATQLSPESVLSGSDEVAAARLEATREQWWAQMRSPLLAYGNHHPSERVRRLTFELVDAVGEAIAATWGLLRSRQVSTTMDAFHEAERTRDAAVEKADRLMDEIRGR